MMDELMIARQERCKWARCGLLLEVNNGSEIVLLLDGDLLSQKSFSVKTIEIARKLAQWKSVTADETDYLFQTDIALMHEQYKKSEEQQKKDAPKFRFIHYTLWTLWSKAVRCCATVPPIRQFLGEKLQGSEEEYLYELIRRKDVNAVTKALESLAEEKQVLRMLNDTCEQSTTLGTAVRKHYGYEEFFVGRDIVAVAKEMVTVLLRFGADPTALDAHRRNVYEMTTTKRCATSDPIPECLEVLPPRPVDPPIVKIVLPE
jgi:hypothetical protein